MKYYAIKGSKRGWSYYLIPKKPLHGVVLKSTGLLVDLGPWSWDQGLGHGIGTLAMESGPWLWNWDLGHGIRTLAVGLRYGHGIWALLMVLGAWSWD